MFSNIALDTVIGLVLVYLLYSLLVTILGELIATWLGLRARVLRIAIERMLNDGYYEPLPKQRWKLLDIFLKAWAWIANKTKYFFLYEKDVFKETFAGRFYNNPSIKYLARLESEKKVLFENTKPSYITPENFSSTLINFLSSKGNGKDKLEQLRFCLKYNTLHIEQDTINNLTALLNNSGDDVNLFKEKLVNWFNETMDRATGWYKRKVKLILFWIGFLLALSFNVDSIEIARILSQDKEARSQLVTMGIELSKDTARYNDFIHKNGDSVHSKAIIDSGYSRVSNDISRASLILGLGWDFTGRKKNCLVEISQKNDRVAYDEMTGFLRYNQLSKQVSGQQKKLAADQFRLDTFKQSSKRLADQIAFDSVLLQANRDSALVKEMDLSKKDLLGSLDSINVLNATVKRDSSTLLSGMNFLRHIDKAVHAATGNKLSAIDSIEVKGTEKDPVMVIHGKRNYNTVEKMAYVVSNVFSKKSRLLGFILTAFALSLGAPFWFGVLNKLVSIRGAGVKPEESKQDIKDSTIAAQSSRSVPGTGNLVTEQATVTGKAEQALDSFTARIKNEPGIVAIALQHEHDDPSAFIMVMVETEKIRRYLEKKYGATEVLENDPGMSDDFSIPVKYSIQDPNEVHAGMAGAEIANISKELGHGTLGCFLKKKGSDANYILSCWHVMKDNADWSTAIRRKEVIDDKNKVIAAVEQGCLADTIDVGIALCNDKVLTVNNDFIIRSQHREVVAFDALVSTDVKIFGKVCKLQMATVFHHKINIRLKYPDGKMHFIQDVFSVTRNLHAPTTGGDSGAVVMDMNGTPLGMIIGGNSNFSYAIKFSNMFNENMLYNEFSFLI